MNILNAQTSSEAYLYVYPSNELAYPSDEGDGPSSKHPQLNSVFNEYEVTTYKKSFPGATSPSLQNAYEIHINGDLMNFLDEIESANLFSTIELAPYYETAAIYTETSVEEDLPKSNTVTSSMNCPNPVSSNDPDADNVLSQINAFCAWSITKGSPDINIAIVDTEFEATHPDLANQLVSVWLDGYWNTHTYPACNHGTQVAGMAASEVNNGLFTAGIGYNSSIAGYVPPNGPSGNTCWIHAYTGIWQAYLDGQPIINLSASGIVGVPTGQTIVDAITEITTNGTLVVFAAGNTTGGSSHSAYANIPGVINVANVATWGACVNGYTYNQFVDVCAPGFQVNRIHRPGGVGNNSGSSLSAPVVAGTAALMLDANPCLTPPDIEQIIEDTANPVTSGDEVGGICFESHGAGILDAYEAVKAAYGYPEPITGSILIDSPAKIGGNIVIANGGQVTISNTTLEFSPKAGIIIEPGGELMVRGSKLTNSCDISWKGIYVEGTPSAGQNFNNQGHVEISNSIIEHAIVAIRADKAPNSNAGSGGIMTVEKTKFTNNNQAISFSPYIPTSKSIFSNCEFIIDDSYPFAKFLRHISLKGIDGVQLYDCKFLDIHEGGNSAASHAVTTRNATVKITTSIGINHPSDLNGSNAKSYFKGFRFGVYAFGNNASYIDISNTLFEDNTIGIYNSALDNAKIVSCKFAIGDRPIVRLNHGVFINVANGFDIRNNLFERVGNSFNTVGTLIKNSHTSGDVIYQNEYSNLDYANLSNGSNKNGNSGLKYECNANFNNRTYDFVVTSDVVNAGIADIQGGYSGEAGNSFGNHSSPVGSDFNNETSPNIRYFYYINNPTNSIGLLKTSAFRKNECEEKIREDNMSPSEKEQLKAKQQNSSIQYSEHQFQYNSLIDNGSTAALITSINTANLATLSNLKAQLMNISPFVSNLSFEAILDRPEFFEIVFITDLLKANPDLINYKNINSQIQSMLTTAEYDSLVYQIAQNEDSARFILEQELDKLQFEFASISQLLIRYEKQQDNINFEEIRNLLKDINSLDADYQIVQSFISEYDFVAAIAHLNQILIERQLNLTELEEHNFYTQLVFLNQQIYQENNDWSNLNDNQLLVLRNIADNSLGRSGNFAKSLLNTHHDGIYEPITVFPSNDFADDDNNNRRNNNDKNEVQNYQQVITAFPNPVKSMLTFFLQENSLNDNIHTIELLDMNGTIIKKIVVREDKKSYELNVSNLPNGIYFYRGISDNSVMNHKPQKIVILH